jgi:hypothetical protein
MYARVVRFTDVDMSQIDRIKSNVANDEPPEGMPPTKLQIVIDESQGTAAVLQFYESEADMQKADEVMNSMDSSETPGTRASVDKGEIVVEGQIGSAS